MRVWAGVGLLVRADPAVSPVGHFQALRSYVGRLDSPMVPM